MAGTNEKEIIKVGDIIVRREGIRPTWIKDFKPTIVTKITSAKKCRSYGGDGACLICPGRINDECYGYDDAYACCIVVRPILSSPSNIQRVIEIEVAKLLA